MFSFTQTNCELINQKSIKRFIRTYAKNDNWHNLDIRTGNLGYGLIHYAYIRNLKPKRILCIGSRYGFIPAICALACRDNQSGIVDFVDAGYGQSNQNTKQVKGLGLFKKIMIGYDQPVQNLNHWGGIGLWSNIDKNKYFKPFGLSSFINLFVMTSAEYAKKYPRRKYEYIYLDGDHSYKGIKTDYNLFYPRLTKNGFIALHDIYTKNLGGLNYGVNRFWQQLTRRHQTIEFRGTCGLGIFQK